MSKEFGIGFVPTEYIYTPENLKVYLVFLEKPHSEMMLNAEDCNDRDTVNKGIVQELILWIQTNHAYNTILKEACIFIPPFWSL